MLDGSASPQMADVMRILANLEPRTIRCEVSQGMIMAGSAADEDAAKGDVCVLRVDRPLPPGSKVS